MRHAARRDENEQEIVDAFESDGWGVAKLSEPGVPDLAVGWGFVLFFVEAIGPEKAKRYRKTCGLTPKQVEWREKHPEFAESVFEVFNADGAKRLSQKMEWRITRCRGEI